MSHHLASSAAAQTSRTPIRSAVHAAFRATAVVAASGALGLAGCAEKSSGDATPSQLRFTEFQNEAQVAYTHSIVLNRGKGAIERIAGGAACADFDGDGFPDLYVYGGDLKANMLFRNRGKEGLSLFEEVGKKAGVDLPGGVWCSASFVHLNGDGHIDIFLGGVAGTTPCLLLNKGDGTFADATPGSGLDAVVVDTMSAAFADYDKDGDLDMFLTHWNVKRAPNETSQHLWRNDGNAVFTDVSIPAGITAAFDPKGVGFVDLSFTPNFADIDGDGYPDLLITGDQGTNLVLRSVSSGGNRVFVDMTTPAVRNSEHATGAAVGDYDGDGDLDWFVAGIYYAAGSAAGPLTGNRLYRNSGDGTFADVTDLAGVGQGGWGWGSSFADFDNDGLLDLIQTNGFGTTPTDVFSEFLNDQTRLFMNRGSSFVEEAANRGMIDATQGRGVVCFDFDRDGDLDVFAANSLSDSRMWRNDLPPVNRNYLGVRLTYTGGNPRGIGSRVKIRANGREQMREIRNGSNYVSQNDAEAHFGLYQASTVERVEVTWPDGSQTVQENVAANQLLHVQK